MGGRLIDRASFVLWAVSVLEPAWDRYVARKRAREDAARERPHRTGYPAGRGSGGYSLRGRREGALVAGPWRPRRAVAGRDKQRHRHVLEHAVIRPQVRLVQVHA